jgi:hypothetical protein
MAVCKRSSSDRLAKELMRQGINIILPPRDGITAGTLVLGDKNGSIRIGDWSIVLGVDPHPLERPEPAFKAVTFKVSDQLSADTGASIGGRLLQSLGIGEGGLQGALKKSGAKQLNLALTSPAVATLENIDAVLKALRDAGARPHRDYADRRLFIVQRIWRARGLSLELQNDAGAKVSLSGEAKDELQANAKVEIMDRGDGRMTFVASTPLVFGLTFRELTFTDGGLTDQDVSEHLTFRGGTDGVDPQHAFATEDDLFVEFEHVA